MLTLCFRYYVVTIIIFQQEGWAVYSFHLSCIYSRSRQSIVYTNRIDWHVKLFRDVI